MIRNDRLYESGNVFQQQLEQKGTEAKNKVNVLIYSAVTRLPNDGIIYVPRLFILTESYSKGNNLCKRICSINNQKICMFQYLSNS